MHRQHAWTPEYPEMNVRDRFSQHPSKISIMHMKYGTQTQSCQKYNFILLHIFEKHISIV